jgi:glycosyltransferase involved in cell wall biosynthesis
MAGVPAGRISFPDAGVHALGMAPDVVSHLYQVFDVLLAPSYGEGFGIPVLEAQACGVPVIVSNFSAQPELCGAGWMVDGQPQWDAPSNAWFFMPAIESIRLQLELAYEARDDLGLRARAREFSLQYDANRVTFDYWLPVLGELGADVAGALERILVTPGESRQARRARERSERKAAVRP